MELKATELRIGNYIFWDIPEKKNIIHVVDAILPNTYHTIPISLGNHKDYRAIPLTEKWLLDFGFKTIMVNLYKLSIETWKELYVSLNSDGNVHFYISNGFNEIVIRRGKLCVHHIQNVFHDFTGEELTINPQKH